MCGRKYSKEELTWAEYREMLEIIQSPPNTNFQPNYNICPTQQVPVCANINGVRSLKTMHWGLVPRWAKDTRYAAKMINARAESLTEKPSFKPLLENNRCIIMVSGFYEWHRSARTKIPFKVERGDGKPMMLGGLWTHNSNLGMDSYSVITTAATPEFGKIHHRMPVIVDPKNVESWLESGWEEARTLATTYSGPIAAIEISPAVNSNRKNGPELLEPAPAKLL